MLQDVGYYPNGLAAHSFTEAQLFFGDANYYQALSALNEARKQTNNRNLLNRITLLEGDIFRSIQKFEQAETNYNSLLVNTDPLEPEYLKTQAYLGLAELEATQDRLEESIDNAKSALSLARSNQFSRQ